MLHANISLGKICKKDEADFDKNAARKPLSHRDLTMPSQMQRLTSATAAEFSTRTHCKHGIMAIAGSILIDAATWFHHQSEAKNAVGGSMRIKQACACLYWAHHRVQCTFINSTVQ